MSYLGGNRGEVILFIFVLMWKNWELVCTHQDWRLETKAQQTCRWQLLDVSCCLAQLSEPPSVT